MQLAGLIKNANYVIANDTGPAHMAAHLNAKGITLFGHHTTPYKVSIETDNFKAIVTKQLKELSADFVYEKIIFPSYIYLFPFLKILYKNCTPIRSARIVPISTTA